MRVLFTLEYKQVDSKGREKTPKFLGVFDNLEKMEEVKGKVSAELGENISFQVYTSEHPF